MADLPITFSAPMVRALLREIDLPFTGKTQTRRGLSNTGPELVAPPYRGDGRGLYVQFQGDDGLPMKAQRLRYVVGDRLYVREHWRCSAKHDATAPRDLTPRSMTIAFEAGGSIANQDDRDDWRPSEVSYTDAHWMGRFRQGVHMPRWASRITLLVTDVRVERLQDCSEADAWAEGCIKGDPDDVGGFFPAEEPDPSGIGWRGWDNARDWYADLWDQINGPGAWELNPWVAAYSFRPILGNIDRIGEAA